MQHFDPAEFAEKMKIHDVRLNHIETATQVANEMQNSIALPLIIKVAGDEADAALALLATVDPSDTKKIIALQGKIYCATMLKEIIEGIIQRGFYASKTIQEEAQIGDLPDGQSEDR